ncbi:Holliday junction resolvase RuvX [Blochmannia endosymbiont of Camponotus (Colobopsis) obliquus]|uniref:Holliday junction resolvase RuvX n=1 Tax=Blochmannia endosymbiont of Camponotus (Colobopsis) obliquus TaxID=1505597 RepID=UPI00061A824A|nr:Holliday junction resolvase RuvX [Blochmannia endosymbiont of Camponotus (Colobopsis) obliquus]AKC60414.1 Putative Holliday junction resolvase [Blochmannia endosymbiont of Camponotus (Colobopsis) obliquus]
MTNIISFDFGIKSIGIAVGQHITCTAQPLTSLQAKNGIPNYQCLLNILNEWHPIIGIIGLPLNINGTEQPLTNVTRKFAKYLNKNFNLKIIMHDERLTTIEARDFLFKNDGYHALKKKRIDAVTAGIILESWLQQKLSKKIIQKHLLLCKYKKHLTKLYN